MTFMNPIAADAGMIVDREPQRLDGVKLPEGLRIVSADNHIELTQDIFFERFPADMRDKAPRVWFDHYWKVGFPEAMQAYPQGTEIDKALARSVMNDGFELGLRNKHLDAEGIAQEIVYPNSLMAFIRNPDQALQELMYRTYNEHMAELGRASPGRFYGVGILPNWWDPAKLEASVRQVADLGLKIFMLPFSPGKDVGGELINYASDEMDRLWAATCEADLTVNFHIGEVPGSGGRGGFGTFFIVQADPFRRTFGQLVFGGVFDRHPALRTVFAEGGISWVAGALQDCELTYGAHRELFDWDMQHRPSWYWHNNMYATFQTDALGLRLIDQIGADRVMWAQDYPHSEGTFGYTAEAVADILAATDEAGARLILGDTARRIYKLD